MRKKLITLTTLILCAVSVFAQTYRNYGAANSSEISRTYGASFWPFYGGHGDSVLIMVSNDGTVSYTSKSGIAVTIDTTSLSNRIDSKLDADSSKYTTPYQNSLKFNISDITQSTSDNSASKVWSAAASYSSAAGKVDTGLITYVANQAQFAAALAANKPNIHFVADVTSTASFTGFSNKHIEGNGHYINIGSITDSQVFLILNDTNVVINNLNFQGNGAAVNKSSNSIIAADSQIVDQVNIGKYMGINVRGSERVTISNCGFYNFTRAGIYSTDVGDHADLKGHGLDVYGNTSNNCYYGGWCGTRSEYSRWFGNSFRTNVCGFYKSSGNINFYGNNVDDNRINFADGAGTNNSHGNIVSNTFNHAGLTGFYAEDITGGEAMAGNSHFEGDIRLVRSIGINMVGDVIACAIRVDGGGLHNFSQCMFHKVYGGGTNTAVNGGVYITSGNNFVDGSDNAVINNTGRLTLQNVTDYGFATTNPIAFMSTYNTNLVQPVTFNINAAKSHSILIQHASTGLSGGVTMLMEVSGFMYGTPGTYFKGYITLYPSNATTIATTAQSATFLINGAALTNPPRVVAAMSNSKITVALADTTQAWPAGSWVRLDNVTTSNTGTQGVNTFWQTGWTMDSTTTNVGFTSTKVITPKVLLSDAASTVTSTQLRDTTILAIDMKPVVTRSSASTLTVAYGGDYTFTGSTGTYTLPAVAAATLGRAQTIVITNQGSGALTVNTNASANVLFTGGALTNTLSISAGQTYYIRPDGVGLIAQLQ